MKTRVEDNAKVARAEKVHHSSPNYTKREIGIQNAGRSRAELNGPFDPKRDLWLQGQKNSYFQFKPIRRGTKGKYALDLLFPPFLMAKTTHTLQDMKPN